MKSLWPYDIALFSAMALVGASLAQAPARKPSRCESSLSSLMPIMMVPSRRPRCLPRGMRHSIAS